MPSLQTLSSSLEWSADTVASRIYLTADVKAVTDLDLSASATMTLLYKRDADGARAGDQGSGRLNGGHAAFAHTT